MSKRTNIEQTYVLLRKFNNEAYYIIDLIKIYDDVKFHNYE